MFFTSVYVLYSIYVATLEVMTELLRLFTFLQSKSKAVM